MSKSQLNIISLLSLYECINQKEEIVSYIKALDVDSFDTTDNTTYINNLRIYLDKFEECNNKIIKENKLMAAVYNG